MVRFSVVVILLGVGLVVYGLYEWRLAGPASAQPEEISLKNLIARGPAGNPNIVLKDFDLCDNFVESHHQNEGPNAPWTEVWVPVVPSDRPQPGPFPFNRRPRQFDAILFSTRVRNHADILTYCALPRLRSMVINRIQGLGAEETNLLQQSYPDTDFSKCLIIHEGREPASPLTLTSLFGAGILLVLTGFGTLLFGMLGRRVDREWQPA
jgi:hypothetical protein